MPIPRPPGPGAGFVPLPPSKKPTKAEEKKRKPADA
jgi:hypothetical protein